VGWLSPGSEQVRFLVGVFIEEVVALGLFALWDDWVWVAVLLSERDYLCKLPALL
jgi:hypothetical protein